MLTLSGNRFESNSSFNLFVFGTWPVVTVLDAELNYWGTTDIPTIEASIFDQVDFGTLPLVDYAPFNDEFGVPVP